MVLYQFNRPDTWDGYRDIDEKINYEELLQKIEETKIARQYGSAAATMAALSTGPAKPGDE